MRQVAYVCVVVEVAAILVVAGLSPISNASALDQPVTFSQVILPLQCTVDIVHDGPITHVKLSPKECMRSPEARELLKQAKKTYRHHETR